MALAVGILGDSMIAFIYLNVWLQRPKRIILHQYGGNGQHGVAVHSCESGRIAKHPVQADFLVKSVTRFGAQHRQWHIRELANHCCTLSTLNQSRPCVDMHHTHRTLRTASNLLLLLEICSVLYQQERRNRQLVTRHNRSHVSPSHSGLGA